MKSQVKLFAIGIVVFAAICVSAIWVWILSGQNSQVVSSPRDVQLPLATPEPFKFEDMTWEVLNGSGKAGAAKAAAVKLEKLGLQVVSIGNADGGTYSQTQVYLPSPIGGHTQEIMSRINQEFSGATYSGELTGSSVSGRLVVGKR